MSFMLSDVVSSSCYHRFLETFSLSIRLQWHPMVVRWSVFKKRHRISMSLPLNWVQFSFSTGVGIPCRVSWLIMIAWLMTQCATQSSYTSVPLLLISNKFSSLSVWTGSRWMSFEVIPRCLAQQIAIGQFVETVVGGVVGYQRLSCRRTLHSPSQSYNCHLPCAANNITFASSLIYLFPLGVLPMLEKAPDITDVVVET